MSLNTTYTSLDYSAEDPFSQLSVKVIFIVIYSLVTVTCVFGNCLVLYILLFVRKMHSITNFFLANLAVADLCVGLFCVMQTLVTPYLLPHWPFGDVMCRLQFFVQSASYTASILILTVISVERYLAIIHPLTSKSFIRRKWIVRLVGIVLWVLASAYASPLLLSSHVVSATSTKVVHIDGVDKEKNITKDYCIDTSNISIKSFVMVDFVLFYVVPLGVMTFIYTRICTMLWRSVDLLSNTVKLTRHRPVRNVTSGQQDGNQASSQISRDSKNRSAELTSSDEQTSLCTGHLEKTVTSVCFIDQIQDESNLTQSASFCEGTKNSFKKMFSGERSSDSSNPWSTGTVGHSRRKVVRLLVVVILCFSLCVLPHHIRQLVHLWGTMSSASYADNLVVPITYLMLYVNSSLNPILYALLSQNFRNAYREIRCFKRST